MTAPARPSERIAVTRSKARLPRSAALGMAKWRVLVAEDDSGPALQVLIMGLKGLWLIQVDAAERG